MEDKTINKSNSITPTVMSTPGLNIFIRTFVLFLVLRVAQYYQDSLRCQIVLKLVTEKRLESPLGDLSAHESDMRRFQIRVHWERTEELELENGNLGNLGTGLL